MPDDIVRIAGKRGKLRIRGAFGWSEMPEDPIQAWFELRGNSNRKQKSAYYMMDAKSETIRKVGRCGF